MKKFSLLIIGILMLILPSHVYASSAKISVSASNNVMLGNNVTVTVTLSSSSKIGSWQVDLSYDKDLLKLTSSTAEGGGTAMVNVAQNGTTSKKYTFTFKTLKKGSAKVSVNSYSLYDYDTMSSMSTTGGSTTINIKTKEEIEASYSDNAYLKSLSVGDYTLDPKFDKETRVYNVEVENEVESVTISASKADSNATVSGTGEKELVEGNNKFEIVVTAQKGNSLTYTVNVYRKELDPISVTVDNLEYTIVRRADTLPEYKTFAPTTVEYEGEEIPALYSEITGITLIGLKDEDGNVVAYIYENNKITIAYVEINNNTYAIIPLDLKENELFASYMIKEIEIDGIKVKAYVLEDTSKFAIIYAQNVETGDITYYSYSLSDKSFQVYNKEIIKFYEKRITNYKYILMGAIGAILLLLLIVMFRKPSKKEKVKYVKEIKEEKIKEPKIEIIEDDPTTEISLIKTVDKKEEVEEKEEKKEKSKKSKKEKEEQEEKKEEKEEEKPEVEEEEQTKDEEVPEEKLSRREKRRQEKIRRDFDF